MATATLLYLRDYTERGLLRRRGEQAYQRMSLNFNAGDVEINLDGLNSMSMSFIDGIVSKLVLNEQLDRVTFVTDSDRTLEKLGTISGFRDTPIFYRPSEQTPRVLVPKVELP